jgi:hypothetical protein
MPSLRETQLDFAHRVFGGGGGGLSPREQIYRNNVFISLTGALADVYPVVKRLVGEPFFNQLARRYMRSHPSRSGNLHDFGAGLPAFVSANRALETLPYLPDIARLEWACHEAFHAAELAPAGLARLSEYSKVPVHPSVRLVASRYPVLAIWQANQDDDPRVVDLDAGGDWLIVFRQGLECQILRSSAGELALLAALRAGTPLGRACEAAIAAEPELDLGAAMGRFVTCGFFSQGVSA